MSLTLGKIHYWLYNKILWYEDLETEIISYVKGRDNDIKALTEHINNQFGTPIGEKELEEIIDTSNIHGWLQKSIEGAELRQAALITEILRWGPGYKEACLEIYKRQGGAAAEEVRNRVETPEEIYYALNDFILEGMPCDRVSNVVVKEDDEFAWETAICLHKPYWDRVGGDVRNFYELREAWIKSFVEKINSDFRYEKSEEGINRILRNK